METDDGSASLTVFDVDDADVGLYRCELNNQHGRAETSASLTVNGHSRVVSLQYTQLSGGPGEVWGRISLSPPPIYVQSNSYDMHETDEKLFA